MILSLFCTESGAYLSQRAVSLHSSGLDPRKKNTHKKNCCAVKNITKAEKQQFNISTKSSLETRSVVTAVTSRSPPIIPTAMASFKTQRVKFHQKCVECYVLKSCTSVSPVQVNRDLPSLRCFKGLNLKGLLRTGRHKRWLARLLRTKPKLQQPWVK